MNKEYKFKIEYEMLQDDGNPNDNSKIRYITCGDTAKETANNLDKLISGLGAFLKKDAKKTSKKVKNELK